MVGGSLLCLIELDVRLCSGKELAHLGDVVLQEVLVQRVSDMQSTNECKCRYLLITVEDLDKMVLEEFDVRLEAVSRPHPDGEKVLTTPLGFMVSGILCEEGLGDLQEVVERAQWRRVEPL